MKMTWTVETMVRGEWVKTVAPAQTKPHLTYSSYAAAERALPFLPHGPRYRLSSLGLPVTVY